MRRVTNYLLLLLVLWFCGMDPVFANKFETISGGVSGMNQEKIRLLKDISLYAGSFLLFLAFLAIVTRNRFEGFIGYSSRKDNSTAVKGAAIVSIAGLVFVGLSFL